MTPTDTITVKAPAKINLFLEVGDKMADGYHNIETVMQSVTLYDELTVRKTDNGIELDCSENDLIYDGNLIVKTAKAFFEVSGIKGGVSVYLRKNIPVAAGLGGGSTDAAATLISLNKLYGSPIPADTLYAIGKRIGADVPFCMRRGLCLATGIGEKLKELKPLPPCFLVIAKGESTVSTREAFELIDKAEHRQKRSSDGIIKALNNGDLSEISKNLYNDFEINNSFDGNIKNVMKKHGSSGVLMSGSGPSVFGIFKNENEAEDANKELQENGYTSFVCSAEHIK